MVAREGSMSHRYVVYGAGLSSTLEFPELQPAPDQEAKWRFAAVAQLSPMRAPVELGTERIYADVHARLFRHAEGHRIIVDDTGAFDIDADGRRVAWQERAESWLDFVRAHLLGRVLAMTMFHDGWLPLHGSAVAVGDGVMAFLAPKGFGKSSLALALTQQGARLVTDDTLPVEPSPDAGAPVAWPGVHSLRMRHDAVVALGLGVPAHETREGKWLVTEIPAVRRATEPLPLRAIYLLDPIAASAVAARELLPPQLAAIGVVAHVKIGRMLGSAAAGAMLERSALITRRVPVFRLHAPRDLARLPDLAATIVQWHGGV